MSEESDGRLLKLVVLAGKGARISVKPLMFLIVAGATTTLMCAVYLRWAMEANWWWSSAPILLMALPLLSLIYYWFSLDGISKLPEALVASKETWAVLRQRYAARKRIREIKGLGPIATMKRMRLLVGLLWDSRDVLDTASNLVAVKDLFNPIFWIVQAISLGCTGIFCTLYTIICASHFFFFS